MISSLVYPVCYKIPVLPNHLIPQILEPWISSEKVKCTVAWPPDSRIAPDTLSWGSEVKATINKYPEEEGS